jgi:hypothetical protein
MAMAPDLIHSSRKRLDKQQKSLDEPAIGGANVFRRRHPWRRVTGRVFPCEAPASPRKIEPPRRNPAFLGTLPLPPEHVTASLSHMVLPPKAVQMAGLAVSCPPSFQVALARGGDFPLLVKHFPERMNDTRERASAMNTYETTALVEEDGYIRVAGVPFESGTEVQVTIKPAHHAEQATAAATDRAARLFAALDKARNTEPVGRLRREEIYDSASASRTGTRPSLPQPNRWAATRFTAKT